MKKIIVTLAVLALIAGAAFAQPSVGGNLKISTNLLAGSTETEEPMAGGATIWDAYTNIVWSGTNAGGMMRLWTKNNEWQPDFFTFWWWKPIEQIRIQLGKNRDGDFGHAQIAGWSFNGEAQGGVALDKDRDKFTNYSGGGYYTSDKRYSNAGESLATIARTAAWWGGFGAGGDDIGIALSYFPMPGFEMDICIPMAGASSDAGGIPQLTAAETYLKSDINFNIAIPDIGNLRFVVDCMGKDPADDSVATPNLHAAFYINAVDGMGIEIGAGFKNDFETIEFGLGYRLIAEALTLKARAGFVAKGKLLDGSDASLFSIGILPAYNFGKLVALFNAGFGIDLNNTEMMDWFVNPYISVPANSGRFYGGLKVYNIKSKGDEDVISWAIPIGWNVYF